MYWHSEQSKTQFKHRRLLKLLELRIYIAIKQKADETHQIDISKEEHSTPMLTLTTSWVNVRICIFFECSGTLNSEQGLFSLLLSFHFHVVTHCHQYFWLLMYQEWLVVSKEYSYKLCGILCLLQTGDSADILVLEICSSVRSRDCGPGGHRELKLLPLV